ncbi:MAG: hypothetical protein SNJ74_04030 [Fimbriimonadaceae bacterium]
MIAVLVACLALGQPQARSETPDAAAIVSRMLARYNSAKTVSGTIQLRVTVKGATADVRTELAIQAPGKIWIRQTRTQPEHTVKEVVADGEFMMYDAPEGGVFRPGEKFVEPMRQLNRTLTFRDAYAASASSLLDRNPILDIAVGRIEDLRFLRFQWATVVYAGRTQLGTEEVHAIRGQWREYGEAPVSGEYRMLITDAGDLRQYAISQTIAASPGSPATTVVPTWTADLKIDADVSPDRFVIRRPGSR